MPPLTSRSLFAALLAWILLAGAACNQVTLPRFGFDEDEPPHPRIPVSATLLFDDTVQNATLQADACGMPWEGQLGHAVAKNFLETAGESFDHVSLGPPTDTSSKDPTPGRNHLTVQISLLRKALEGSTRIGDEDTYSARMNVQLMAVVLDADGKPVGKAPLSYSERVNVWTPILMGAQGSCPTGQLDGLVDEAASELADQMVAAVGAWYSQAHPQAAPTQAEPPGSPASTGSTAPVQAGVLAIRTTLLDENDNLILEGGEKVGVRIDVTNTGPDPIPSATVSLSGTSTVIDAFASAAAGALEIGPIQRGETKSTIFWGKLPGDVAAQRGELAVSVTAMGSTSTQTLVAAIRPKGGEAGGISAADGPPPSQGLSAPASPAPAPSHADRQAVLINLTTYRTSWAEAEASRSGKFPHLVRVLRTEGGLSRNQMLVLTDRGATRADLEEGLLRWLPAKVTPNSVVLVYLSTRAVTDGKTGEIHLIPYDGSPDTPHASLVSLQALQGTLKRVKARLCLLLIDAPIVSNQAAQASTAWEGLLDSVNGSGVRLVQVVASNGALRLDHLLVLGLGGQADANQDKQVTLGELLDYLAVGAHIHPTLPASAPERAIPLTG